jgi:hypothetical protein
MEHLSDWHSFDPNYRSTYPKVNSYIQVKYANGSLAEGNCRKFFPREELLPHSLIVEWRYIKDKAI